MADNLRPSAIKTLYLFEKHLELKEFKRYLKIVMYIIIIIIIIITIRSFCATEESLTPHRCKCCLLLI